MHNTLNRWCARGLLALLCLGLAASAQAAAIYDFTFTDPTNPSHIVAAGSFTTDGAALDPGYDLLASLTFDYVTGLSSGTVYVGPFTTTTFMAGAAYNPATGAFINHSFGTFPDFGGVTFVVGSFRDIMLIEIDSGAFALGGSLEGVVQHAPSGDHDNLKSGSLTVTPAVSTVPEPTSLLLLGSGLLVPVVSRWRKRLKHDSVAAFSETNS